MSVVPKSRQTHAFEDLTSDSHRVSARPSGVVQKNLVGALTACQGGDLKALMRFLDLKAQLKDAGDEWEDLELLSPNTHDKFGRTLLMHGATFGWKNIVRYLTSFPGVMLDEIDSNRMTCLHHAARKQNVTNYEPSICCLSFYIMKM